MLSIGGAVLLEVVVLVGVIALALRRLRAELEPTRRSCDRLHDELFRAVQSASRDTGRAVAGRQLLLRRGGGHHPAAR
jgi:hypothetical protein